ncbi:MAG TPA: hypothetical protein VLC98_04640 [Phnomibacter sp.]|nr:hypothetical protein [Phnomibacter sp.]
MKKLSIALVPCFALLTLTSNAQVFTNKEVGKKNVDLADSLKKSEWPHTLPFLGKKATQKGYNLPLPAGLSVQAFSQKSDLVLDNMMVGFNNGPMYNLDEIVRFNTAIAKATAVTIRPDVWVLPFLDVYGIFGTASASTDISAGIWAKGEDGSDVLLTEFNTKVEFSTTTYGFGMTPTIGVGGGFMALDFNVAWTDVPQLKKPAQTVVFGPRFGKAFKLKKPNQNIAVWVGGFRVKLKSETAGSLALSDVFPEDGEFQSKIDGAIVKVGEKQQAVDSWWAGLTPVEQKNPVNIAKHNAANAVLTRTGDFLAAADAAAENISNSTVQYSMDKQVKNMWNFIVGSQYQINRHFMLRLEAGFLGSRTQVLGGVQYRFGL